ncbi:hypothetical protein H6F42_03555 [Pseudanabaena sp. FACHB-1998]|uniref:hypothetical protein n=1 Tax=Pseudanabaena sp. FACHB-1998 TaxID=2692858 RepID=UPI0016817BDC|nr:hypothetical protein [Pseudanabaena sp. FACHB-1998]MBD2175996.1 hypothetical protein [Pseudanabaena sp. FACHB-1998]
MKKSSVYRALQIASAVAVYSLTSVWASTNHVDIVSNTITSINSLLVILAIAVVFPYFCFKALAKLYTPPASRAMDNSSSSPNAPLNPEEREVLGADISKTMRYRGSSYGEALRTKSDIEVEELPVKTEQPVFKYRGVVIENSPNGQNIPSESQAELLSPEDSPQKAAKPKERIKYRGSYVD